MTDFRDDNQKPQEGAFFGQGKARSGEKPADDGHGDAMRGEAAAPHDIKSRTAVHKPGKTDIHRYQDPDGMTPEKMAIGLWYVEHKRIFVLIFIWFLSLVGAVSWAYTFYHAIYYVAIGMKEDQKMVNELVRSSLIGHDYLLEIGPKNLQFEPAQVLKGETEDTYDFFAHVRNPNKKHFAKFDYYFSAGGETYGQASGFILPEENKYLITLGQKIERLPNESRLVVSNLKWGRVNAHEIPDWSAYRNDHLDIAIENIVFTPSSETILTEKLDLNDLKFTVMNDTAYNYKQADFAILLVKNNKIIGVHKYILNKFGSGQRQDINIIWPGKFGRIDKVLIMPEIDITRDDIYYKFGSDQNVQ